MRDIFSAHAAIIAACMLTLKQNINNDNDNDKS